MKNRLWLATVTVFLLVVTLVGPLGAGANIIQEELTTRQKKLSSIEKSLKRKKRVERKLKKEQRDVLADIQELDRKIALQWQSLQQAKKDWTDAELQLDRTRNELEQMRRRAAALKNNIEVRLNAFRQMGEIGVLNILLAADSIPNLLARQEYLKMIVNNDQAKRREYATLLKELTKKEKELKDRQILLKAVSTRLEKEALLLEERKAEKERYLESLKKKRSRYRRMISQLERARRRLTKVVEELTMKARATSKALEPVTQESQFDFRAQKGRLNLPVPGRVIIFSKKRTKGIAVECPWGTEIRAIFDGKVVFNDSLPGYGRVFIVDHGNGYMSLIAQGQSFKKKVGDEVAEGEVVGLSGGGPWVSEGVYIEIRHNGRPLTAKYWFDLRGIEIVRR
ncbi:MAG: peptidoglycan DD-metalloendopeptidase family protein [Thermodesulfobacteria bacterium]|nr:peptidoglycan DD-metalloendopeptidase family protein [Thermodesulfobacteriota bacterium]